MASSPRLKPPGSDLHEQIRRLEEALLESQSRLEAKEGACGHAWQRLQSSQNDAISLRAGLREEEAEITRLRARCEAAEKRLERFEAASLSVLERAGGGGDNFNSSYLPRASPAPAVSPAARVPTSEAHRGGGGDLFRRWGIDLEGGASAAAEGERPASRPSGGLETFKSAAHAAAEAEDMEAGVRALSAALGGGHTPGLAPLPTPALKGVDSRVSTAGPSREPAGLAGASKEELEEAVRWAVAQGLKGAFEGELLARDVRIQELEQKLESGGWHSMAETPATARPPPSAGAFSFGVAATQQPREEPGLSLQPVPPPQELPPTPRTAFFASQKVPGSIKSGIEGSLTQMKRATSDFRQAKDTIRTAMKGLSSEILAGRRIG